jgi:hypothetical protein
MSVCVLDEVVCVSLTHSHTLSFSLSNTHTHTLSLSLSHSPYLFPPCRASFACLLSLSLSPAIALSPAASDQNTPAARPLLLFLDVHEHVSLLPSFSCCIGLLLLSSACHLQSPRVTSRASQLFFLGCCRLSLHFCGFLFSNFIFLTFTYAGRCRCGGADSNARGQARCGCFVPDASA